MPKKYWKLFSLIVIVFAGLALSVGTVAVKKAAEQEKRVSIDEVSNTVKATILAQSGAIEEIEMKTKNSQIFYEADFTLNR
jgi:hypothetical protein